MQTLPDIQSSFLVSSTLPATEIEKNCSLPDNGFFNLMLDVILLSRLRRYLNVYTSYFYHL